MLNRWTGGNEYQSGLLDFNPEALEYIVGSYAGAGAKTAVRALFTDPAWLFKSLTGRDTSKYDMNDVVFLRRIYGEINPATVSGVFYDTVEEVKQAEQAWKNLPKEQRSNFKDEYGWMIPLFGDLKQAEKEIRATEDPDVKDKARKRFNKKYREAWINQFD